jgi:hypothetical protein
MAGPVAYGCYCHTGCYLYIRAAASLAVQRDIGDRHHQAVSVHRLGRGLRQAGGFREAYELFTEALELCEELREAERAVEIRADLAAMTDQRR